MGTTAAARGGIVRFDPNDPVEINEAKFIDLVGGKYGPQVRIKGTINGQENALAYLPGQASDVLTALMIAGVILDAPDTLPAEDDRRGFQLQRGPTREFTVTLSQRNGQKETRIETPETATPEGPVAPAPVAPKPVVAAKPAAKAVPVAKAAAPAPAPAPVPVDPAIADDIRKTKRSVLASYQTEALCHAVETYPTLFRAVGVEPDADTIHKLAFELFKSWMDRGIA